MKRVLILFILISYFSNSQTFQWVANSSQGSKNDQPTSIVNDSSGNSYVLGTFQKTIAIGQNSYTTPGTIGTFIAKYNASGVLVWLTTGTSSTDVYPSELAIDQHANLYFVAMTTASLMTIGSTTVNAGRDHNVLCRLKPNGSMDYAKDFVQGPLAYRPQLICRGGNLFMHSTFGVTGTVVIGTNSYISQVTDCLLAKFDTLGNPIWSQAFGGTMEDEASGLAVNQANEIFITGSIFSPLVVIGTTSLAGHMNTAYTAGASYLAKFNSAGQLQWAKTNTTGDIYEGSKIASDNYGNVYLTGNFYDTVRIDSHYVTSQTGEGFISKMNSNGNCDWMINTNTYGAYNNTGIHNIESDSEGNTFVCGATGCGTLSLGTYSVSNNCGPAWKSIFGVIDKNGIPKGLLGSGGSSRDAAYCLTVDQQGIIYLAGIFQGTTVTSPGISTLGNFTLTGNGGGYMYVAKIAGLTVGLSENSDSDQALIEIYPSPSNGKLNILSEGSNLQEVGFYDLNGKQLILKKNLNASSLEMDLSQNASGLYICKIQTSKGIYIRKIILE